MACACTVRCVSTSCPPVPALPAGWAAETGQDFTANHQIKTIDCEACVRCTLTCFSSRSTGSCAHKATTHLGIGARLAHSRKAGDGPVHTHCPPWSRL